MGTAGGGVGLGAGGFAAGGCVLAATNGGGSSGVINMLIISGVQTTSLLSVFAFLAAGGVAPVCCCTGRIGRGAMRLLSGILAAPGEKSFASDGRLADFFAEIGVVFFLLSPLPLQHVVLSCFIKLLMVCTERFLSFMSFFCFSM